jgi:hypothetical protein
MQVNFKKAEKLGNRSFKAGAQVVPDSMAHNLAFKALVKSGGAQIIAKDESQQKIQLAKDAKNHKAAQDARKASKAAAATMAQKPEVPAIPAEAPAPAAPTTLKGKG